MKGKLGITSSGSGSGSKFNQKFMRSITMSPGGSTWQVCLHRFPLNPTFLRVDVFVSAIRSEQCLSDFCTYGAYSQDSNCWESALVDCV